MGNRSYQELIPEEEKAFRVYKKIILHKPTHRPYSVSGEVVLVDALKYVKMFTIEGEPREFYLFEYANKDFYVYEHKLTKGAKITIVVLPIFDLTYHELPYLFAIKIT
jgi:hypothetical protein